MHKLRSRVNLSERVRLARVCFGCWNFLKLTQRLSLPQFQNPTPIELETSFWSGKCFIIERCTQYVIVDQPLHLGSFMAVGR